MKTLAELWTLGADHDNHRAYGLPCTKASRDLDDRIEYIRAGGRARKEASNSCLEKRRVPRVINEARRPVAEFEQRDIGISLHLAEKAAQRTTHVVHIRFHRTARVRQHDDAERLRCG